MIKNRASGILLHPTSLPGTAGIGTLGKYAYKFIDWLCSANQKLWQVLPLGPTGYGDSPYASFSTYAGNPLLIDLDTLVKQGFLDKNQIVPPEYIYIEGNVDFGAVVYWKQPLLKKAATQFLQCADTKNLDSYISFKKENASWLAMYTSFMSIKETYDKKAQENHVSNAKWNTYWPEGLRACNPNEVKTWNKEHEQECEVQKVIQYFYFSQWNELKRYANDKGISIIGDIPIFVASDSADVWSNQNLFQISKDGTPLCVAGVPPDYFSADGQLWGNPLYDWEAMKKDGYSWWMNRIKMTLKQVDYVRIDHFRGFDEYWSVPFGEKTAVHGKWMPGPKSDFFNKVKESLGDIPILAEDLGIITDSVRNLRDEFELPGMKILQFAFDENEMKNGGLCNAFLPHMYSKNCIVYPGSHDNDTLQGWITSLQPSMKKLVASYLGIDEKSAETKCADGTICREMIRLAISSTALWAIIPMQDIFELGTECRMNTPSTSGGINWQWRMNASMFDSKKAQQLKNFGILYGRNMY